MMKPLAHLMALGIWTWALQVPAQGFIKHFDLEQNGRGGRALSVREVPGGFLLFCQQQSDDGTANDHLFTRLLDGSGTQVIEREFCVGVDREFLLGTIPFDPVATCSDGNFAAAVWTFGEDYGTGIRLFTFNENGDTVSTRSVTHYAYSDSVSLGCDQMRQCLDGGFFIVGGIYPYMVQPAHLRAFLIRTDPLGDTLWTAQFHPDPDVSYGARAVIEYDDGGAIILGYRHPGFVEDNSFILRTDALGNEIWVRYFGAETNGDFGALRVNSVGEVVTWTPYYDDTFQNQYWGQFMLTKWNADGDIVWQQRSHYGYDYYTSDLAILPDNSIIAVGKHVQGAQLMKFSPEGDSLWTRTYLAFPSGDDHLLFDVQATSDGGFVAAGSCQQYFGDPTPTLITEWVVKTDSLGCVVPGCQNVGVQEYEIGLQEQLVLSPNPANDRLTFQLPLPNGFALEGKSRVVILDAQGRAVLEQSVTASNSELNGLLDVGELPSGLYYFHMRDQRRWLAGGKVVVE